MKYRPSVIFLDIDGVLNDHKPYPNGYNPILYHNVINLNHILAEIPEAIIVLSSAWRYVFNTAKLVETLLASNGANCVGRVQGVTRLDEDVLTGGGMHPGIKELDKWHSLGLKWRKKQIMQYALEHGFMNRFVVLDDLPLEFPVSNDPSNGITSNVMVKTDPSVGLTAADAVKAICILEVAR